MTGVTEQLAQQRRAVLEVMLTAQEWGGEPVALLLDWLERAGRLAEVDATALVPIAWDLTGWPMRALPRERWVALFELAGYTHDYVPAERPPGPLRLFRGSDGAGGRGMCWSSSIDIARLHAARFDEGFVWTAWVEPSRLLAFVAPVYEDQFVVDTRGLVTQLVEDAAAVAALDLVAVMNRIDAAAEAGR